MELLGLGAAHTKPLVRIRNGQRKCDDDKANGHSERYRSKGDPSHSTPLHPTFKYDNARSPRWFRGEVALILWNRGSASRSSKFLQT